MYGPKTRVNGTRPHGPKTTVLGSGPHGVPPAWKSGYQQPKAGPSQSNEGNKILISGLPFDVEKDAIVELLGSTVGPLEDVTCVYTKQGQSTGMSIVRFKQAQHAHDARRMYNGKVVDQQRPIKVEIIGEPLPTHVPMNATQKAQPPPPPQPSLIERLGMIGSAFIQAQQGRRGPPHHTALQIQQRNAMAIQQQGFGQPSFNIPTFDNNQRRPRKKGPKRLQKARNAHWVPKKKTAAQLDAEMDDYRSSAPKPPPSSP
ncbi:hypothetical protein FRB90_012602 [Tulasnella sp. 427]|nr:hypothetical protein FRB90_012602 [Tulasnella sp. 427]